MKTLLSFFLGLLLASLLTAQHIPLKGTCYLHNSRTKTGVLTPLPGVSVTVLGKGLAAISDAAGGFTLVVVGMDAHATLELLAEASGMELVNFRDLENVTVGQRSRVKVYMAPKGQVDYERARLEGVSLAALTKTHDAYIARLRKGGAEMQAAIEEIRAKTNRVIADGAEAERVLNEQLEATKRRLPEFAEKLARVNLDFASEMYRKAYAYFEQGEIDSAIVTLDEAILDEQARMVMEQMDTIDQALEWLDRALWLTEEHVIELVKAYELRITAEPADPQLTLRVYRTGISVLERRGSRADALAQFQRSISKVHMQLGATDSAITWLSKACPKDHDGNLLQGPENDVRLLVEWLGIRAEELELEMDITAAQKCYRQMLHYLPENDPQAREVRKRLKMLEGK